MLHPPEGAQGVLEAVQPHGRIRSPYPSAMSNVKFFIPHVRDDPVAAKAEWQCHLREPAAPSASPVCSRLPTSTTATGTRYLGEARKCFRKETALEAVTGPS